MSSAAVYLEEIIYKLLSDRLSDEEKLSLTTGWDVEKHIDEESEDEMRNELFYYIKSHIRWSSIITLLQDEAEEEEEESESESKNNSDEE